MEKLTDLDCIMIDNIKMLERWRKNPIEPSMCGSQTEDVGKYFFDGDDTDKPIMVYRGDMGDRSDFLGDSVTIMAEIISRCGDQDLKRRKALVEQERLYRIWGGRDEYYKIFPWLRKGYSSHRDADVVDNFCTECGKRGVAKNLTQCADCRKGDF